MNNQTTLKRDELEHGAYYKGHCRNASVARYNAETDKFLYRRYKFGHTFIEDIGHAENDNGYDLFEPFEKIAQPDVEIPLVVT